MDTAIVEVLAEILENFDLVRDRPSVKDDSNMGRYPFETFMTRVVDSVMSHMNEKDDEKVMKLVFDITNDLADQGYVPPIPPPDMGYEGEANWVRHAIEAHLIAKIINVLNGY